jgi:fungal nitric oxide reductase
LIAHKYSYFCQSGSRTSHSCTTDLSLVLLNECIHPLPGDQSVFPNADVFDIHRKRGIEASLGFGYGPHECVAEWLARAELESVFCEYSLAIYSPLAHVSIREPRSPPPISLSNPAVLFQTLPNLRLAVNKEDLELTPPTLDIGIVALPVIW